MLHLETIEPRTFSLLKVLMEIQLLQPFTLVGGTALALRYGHRSSIDLDLFSNEASVSFKKQTWEGVKKGIQRAGRDYLR